MLSIVIERSECVILNGFGGDDILAIIVTGGNLTGETLLFFRSLRSSLLGL